MAKKAAPKKQEKSETKAQKHNESAKTKKMEKKKGYC